MYEAPSETDLIEVIIEEATIRDGAPPKTLYSNVNILLILCIRNIPMEPYFLIVVPCSKVRSSSVGDIQ